MIKISFSDQIEKFPGRTDGRTDGQSSPSSEMSAPFAKFFGSRDCAHDLLGGARLSTTTTRHENFAGSEALFCRGKSFFYFFAQKPALTGL